MEPVIPQLAPKLEVYDDIHFPISKIAIDKAQEANCIGLLTADWRCKQLFPYEQAIEKLGEKYPDLKLVFQDVHAYSNSICLCLVFDVDGKQYPIAFQVEKSNAKTSIYFHKKEEAHKILEALREFYPSSEPGKDEPLVQVNFWVRGTQGGPRKIPRSLSVLPLKSVEDNYDTETKNLLVDLAKLEPRKGGQILLFTGIPGTGKTHAIRSLLWEWRDWADFHYVVDPNTFFGDAPDYLMKVIFDELGDGEDFILNRHPSEEDSAKIKWKIIILEDAGELIGADAKTHIRHGMAQLLNLTDGMLGQGLKLIFLITTNEEIGKLDPAISRPGRCAVRHEFKKLDKDQVSQWLTKHQVHENDTEPMTIAQLYAKVDGSDKHLGFNPTQPSRKAGFT